MLKTFLVLSVVLLGCNQRGLSAPLEEDGDSAGFMCAWNSEGCKEKDETNGYSEYNENGGVYDGTEIISDRNNEIKTERSSDWEEQDSAEIMKNWNAEKDAERTKTREGQLRGGMMEDEKSNDGEKYLLEAILI